MEKKVKKKMEKKTKITNKNDSAVFEDQPFEDGGTDSNDATIVEEKIKNNSTDEVDALKEQLDRKSEEAKTNFDTMLRLKAEFDNYKKRIQKEQNNLYLYSNQDLVEELLDVVNNLERALGSAKEEKGTNNVTALKEGIEMTLKQFVGILENAGLKPIESLHKPFNPELHEALTQVETDEYEENTIVEEFQKGYFFKERVLKHSKVIVSKMPDQSKNSGTDDPKQEDEPVK